MKNLFLLCLLILSGCQLSDKRVVKYFSSINVFSSGQQCPHICWLGINPGTTTVDRAEAIVRASNQIDQKWTQITDSDIFAVWYPGKPQTFPSNVGIQFEKGLVKSISFTKLPFTLDEFIKLLGEPEKININDVLVADAEFIAYKVYFPSQKVMIEFYPGSPNGPDPNDTATGLLLNTEFISGITSGHGPGPGVQPWLGYGHLNDYLPGIK